MATPGRPGVVERLSTTVLNTLFSKFDKKVEAKKQGLSHNRKKEAWMLWKARLPKGRHEHFDATKMTRICNQSQATFFARLPLELRRLIYEYMSGELIKLDETGDEDYYRHPFGPGPTQSDTFKSGCPMLLQMLAFPQSCKMAYQEMLPYIYNSNTFYIPDITSFFCFHRRLAIHHLQNITFLRLRWSYARNKEMYNFWAGIPPSDEDTWKETWLDISDLKNLVHIRVDMVMWGPYMVEGWETDLFSAIKDVPRPERIEVFTSWTEDDGKEWPFRVTRGVEGLKDTPEQAFSKNGNYDRRHK